MEDRAYHKTTANNNKHMVHVFWFLVFVVVVCGPKWKEKQKKERKKERAEPSGEKREERRRKEKFCKHLPKDDF